MRVHWKIIVCAGLVAQAQAAVQDTPVQGEPPAEASEVHELSMRIIALRDGGLVVVDRGTADGLLRGDRVAFTRLSGGTFYGRVVAIEERRAGVQLDRSMVRLDIGTRGETRVPLSRFEEPEVDDAELPVVTKVADHDGWQRADDGWSRGQPLLAKVEAIRPEKRPAQISGRAYLNGDHAWTSQAGRSDFFYRAGTSILAENLFDRGGALHFDAELNYRATDLPDNNPDEAATRLRIDRASYSWGGTRFNKERQEAGRFLQDGVSEFGILDGYEYGRRLENGDRYGVSAGFMPEPTPQMKSGNDFQVAGYYQWVSDKREELSATGGFQKTLHNGSADRDLLIGKLRYLPLEGWDFNGTLWLDLYSGGDANASSPIGLTQAVLSSGRRWDDGSSMTLSMVHRSFPDIKRFELEPVAASQLASDRLDRVSASGWTVLDSGNRWHNRCGLWLDQDDAGGDIETGIEVQDFMWQGGRADLSIFGSQGAYSLIYGVRAEVGGRFSGARWDLAYEFSSHDLAGFSSNNDTIFQHRVSGDFDIYTMRDWTLSLNGTGVVWNKEKSVRMGFYLQRSF